jgi:hypothetical protein
MRRIPLALAAAATFSCALTAPGVAVAARHPPKHTPLRQRATPTSCPTAGVGATTPTTGSRSATRPTGTPPSSCHVRAVPAPGLLAVRQRVRHIAGGRVDEECDVWDSTGRLVATGHQLAGLRIPDGQAPATRR